MSDASEIASWIVVQVARELHLPPEAIDPDRPIATLGIDSLAAATLTADLEDFIGRPVPETLFRDAVTISAISRLVADVPAAAVPTGPARAAAAGPDYTSLDYGAWTRPQRALQSMARGVARFLTRQDVQGIERLPPRGAVIVAINHLHILDALWIFSVLPRRTVFMVASEFRRRPIVGWLLRMGDAIFVERGQGDRQAIQRAVDALRAGAAVGVAPEGRLSRTGGLIRGQSGIARLAAESSAPVVPIAMSGQERLWRYWLTARRVPVRIRCGSLIPPPAGTATARTLDDYADAVMRALAEALPPEYRGVYGQAP